MAADHHAVTLVAGLCLPVPRLWEIASQPGSRTTDESEHLLTCRRCRTNLTKAIGAVHHVEAADKNLARTGAQFGPYLLRVPFPGDFIRQTDVILRKEILGEDYDQQIREACRAGFRGSWVDQGINAGVRLTIRRLGSRKGTRKQRKAAQPVPLEASESAAWAIDADRVRHIGDAITAFSPSRRRLWEGRRQGKTWEELATELQISAREAQEKGQQVIALLARKLDTNRSERA
jgi:hypothetical protein